MNTFKALTAGLLLTIGIVACAEQADTEAEDRKAIVPVKTVSCGMRYDRQFCAQCKQGGTEDCCAGASVCFVCAVVACLDEAKQLSCCLDP